jgi:dolichol-phosphate mannosyltransferase
MLSIIVPTLNEKENLATLVSGTFAVLREEGLEAEMIIVDDNSPDGTAEAARALEKDYPVRTVVRRGASGLATAVLSGISHARGEILAVMDADLSHPAEALPLLRDTVAFHGADMAVGSRYIPGGGTEGWPRRRIAISRLAGFLARGLTGLKDPTFGYFAFRRDLLGDFELKPVGCKIGLEILVKTRAEKIEEVPIVFRERRRGRSKFRSRTVMEYLRHLASLYRWKYGSRT